jgi:pyruvate formate lyase activating enzyme
MNLKKHKLITGVENLNELALIKFLEKHKQKYWIRYVLVPNDYTNRYDDLNLLGIFLKSLKYMERFELLPYHRLGLRKYKQLHIKNKLIGVKEPTKAEVALAKRTITSA